ncbi:MAG TPA: ANTAR domain-containing protein [Streptomyces sp.]|nr:ANTAR domain-containing protein [Streptomyces sp.]
MRESAAPVPEEVARLKRDLGLRGRIDEAAGVLMAVGGLSPAVGRTALRAVAAKTGIKLGDVARLVVNWAHTGRLAGDIREALELELARRSPMTRSAGPKTGSTAACDERGDHATR